MRFQGKCWSVATYSGAYTPALAAVYATCVAAVCRLREYTAEEHRECERPYRQTELEKLARASALSKRGEGHDPFLAGSQSRGQRVASTPALGAAIPRGDPRDDHRFRQFSIVGAGVLLDLDDGAAKIGFTRGGPTETKGPQVDGGSGTDSDSR